MATANLTAPLHLSAIQAAIKAKAPIVAIPIEGHAPLCINQKRLKAALKGVEITGIEIIAGDGPRCLKGKGGPYPALKTVYAAPGYDFIAERNRAVDELLSWPRKSPVLDLQKISTRKCHRDTITA